MLPAIAKAMDIATAIALAKVVDMWYRPEFMAFEIGDLGHVQGHTETVMNTKITGKYVWRCL